jgi:DNA-binding transcriptional ArsR family regulator
MTLSHPESDQITLSTVLAALGDETRLAIIGCLARREDMDGLVCGQMGSLCSKTNLTYHVAKLRESGLVNVRPEGTRRRVTLRRADLDRRFPGFLDSVIANAIKMPLVERTLQEVRLSEADRAQ